MGSLTMFSEGAVMRNEEENLTLFESLLFHQYGNAYRTFNRESAITDRWERMSAFIKLNFELSYGIEYTRFTAEARREIPVNFIRPAHSGTQQTTQNLASIPPTATPQPSLNGSSSKPGPVGTSKNKISNTKNNNNTPPARKNSSLNTSKSSKSKSESSSTPLKDVQMGSGAFGGGKRSGRSLQSPKEGKEAPEKRKKRKKVEELQKKAEEPKKIQQTTSNTPQTPGRIVRFEESDQELTETEDEEVVEEVKEEDLVKYTTIWGTIGEGEPVFARWTDKNYYSGNIVEKAMSESAWKIAFDDNMVAVASETHILPVKILGVGIQCVYCPDIVYQPSLCTIIGQKFLDDGRVQYAVQCIDQTRPLYCSQRHLSIKEVEAKKIRKEFED